jgi:hypothetical protein
MSETVATGINFGDKLLPATLWLETVAQQIIENGYALTEQQVKLARLANVRHPEEILLLPVESLPRPRVRDLDEALLAAGLLTPTTEALTISYNIVVLRSCMNDSELFAHQFVRVAQYERYEGIPHFVEMYFAEIQRHGYPMAPMEREARAFTARMSNRRKRRID